MSEIRAAGGAEARPDHGEAKPARAGKRVTKREALALAAAEARVGRLRRLGLGAALGALWVLGGCGGGVSGEIGRACMMSGRDSANAQLCSCIQGVANQSLSGTDQRRVARFFTDPEEAEEMRASDSTGSEAFWDRYRAFSDRAEAICG